ncbi:MAG: thioredoxin [Planctomycetes bacterium]|nr:thioredoxin [Planctomycetota bacterium]
MGAASNLSAAEFENSVKTGAGVSVIDFGASWCGPCQTLAPAYEKLATEFQGRARLFKVDVDAELELSAHFEVMSVPTIVFIKDGETKARIQGNYPDKIRAQIDALLR